MVLDCFIALADNEMSEEEQMSAALLIFYDDLHTFGDVAIQPDLQERITAMMQFFSGGEDARVGNRTKTKIVDWKKDSQLIISAINNVAGKEVRAEKYVHWWTFLSYYTAIGESSFSYIVSIRNKLAKGKKLEKSELEFKRENPHYFDLDTRDYKQRALDEEFRNIWNGGD